MNVRLTGLFTLRAPLSHIGEAISTISYLVQEPILQDDGSIEEVFCYSGNAWRGQLRDLAAEYMLDRLGAPALPTEAFHLLFSGGRIGGEMTLDLEQARRYRRSIPMTALWGGGVGNQVLPGKLRVQNSYPLCEEALPVLPPEHHGRAIGRSYRGMTFEKSFSRKDDAKDERLVHFLAAPEPATGQTALPGETAPPKRGRSREAPPDQMRMTVELVAAGVQLHTAIDALSVSEIELGCLVSALHQFSRSPHIGGQANRGHGLVDLVYRLIDPDADAVWDQRSGAWVDLGPTGRPADQEEPFLAVRGGRSLLSTRAQEAREAYDAYLREQYAAMLARQGGEIVALLGAGGTGKASA